MSALHECRVLTCDTRIYFKHTIININVQLSWTTYLTLYLTYLCNYFWIWNVKYSQMKRRQGSGRIVGIHLHIYSFKSPYVTANCLLHFVLLNVCDINLFLVNNKIFAPFWKTLLSAARLFDRFWQLAVSSSWNKLSAVSCLLVQLWTPPWCCAQYWHCRTWMDNMDTL